MTKTAEHHPTHSRRYCTPLLIKAKRRAIVIFPKNDGLPTMDYTINHGNDVTDIHDHLTNAHS